MNPDKAELYRSGGPLDVTEEEVLSASDDLFCERMIWFRQNEHYAVVESLMQRAKYTQLVALHNFNLEYAKFFPIPELVWGYMRNEFEGYHRNITMEKVLEECSGVRAKVQRDSFRVIK